VKPNLDDWLDDPAVRVSHRRAAAAGAPDLWEAARTVRLADTRRLGPVLRWRLPGVPADITYDELFRAPPFTVLDQGDGALLSGLVGRIWTLRRDYPALSDPGEFRRWSAAGTVRVLFGNWVEPAGVNRTALVSETRIGVSDRGGRLGLALVRPLIAAFHSLVGSEALAVAVRRAEGSA
jgi:hypothetical protein